jgi:putative transposase
MAELERWLTLEICEQYHRRNHKGIHQSPIAAWEHAMRGVDGLERCLPDYPDQFTISFLPFQHRKLRRDGLHLFSIRYWDNVLPTIVNMGEVMMVRYDPRNLAKVYVLGPDQRYFPIPYSDLSLPPITLWEQRAALANLRSQGDNAPAQAAIFQAVTEQRALIASASSKTKAARRQLQRTKNSELATMDRKRSEGSPVDYSKPVMPSDAEIWED